MKGVVAALLACAAAAFLGAPSARAATVCGVPSESPRWIDYGGHDAPFTPKPGMTLAVSSGTETPTAMRAAGAATVFFDLHLNDRVGTTSNPADPATIPAKAKRLFDFAVLVTGCATPIVAENELFGAQTETPWSTTNAHYRANVLLLLQELQKLGAQPAITIANPPYTGGEAADWWRAAAQAALLIRQVYFTRPNSNGLYKLGPARASRSMRVGMRGLVAHLTEIGIPANRIALELQFQSVLGQGGREGLQPLSAWLEVVKLEALAAKQVARETKIDSVWSWGWATFSTAGIDADKPIGVCVWLWARDGRLCDGPTRAPGSFDASLTEGQLLLPRGARCVLGDGTRSLGRIGIADVGRTSEVTGGDRSLAASALLERAVLRDADPVDPLTVLSAERALLRSSFGGSRARLRVALAASHLGVNDLRALLADRISRSRVEEQLRGRRPSRHEIDDFLISYGSQSVRLVESTVPAPWLDGARRGWVVDSLAPPALFALPTGKRSTVDTVDGRFLVRALGTAVPLALLPEPRARVAAASALASLGKDDAYATWLDLHEREALAGALCLRDEIPDRGPVDLASFAPALGL